MPNAKLFHPQKKQSVYMCVLVIPLGKIFEEHTKYEGGRSDHPTVKPPSLVPQSYLGTTQNRGLRGLVAARPNHTQLSGEVTFTH